MAPSTRSRKRAAPFPFLALPPELRRNILRELLVSMKPIHVFDFSARDPTDVRKTIKHELTPAVLRSCKQLHAEGQDILYLNTAGCRCIYVKDHSIVRSDLPTASNIPQAIREKFKRVTIYIDVAYRGQKIGEEMREQVRRLARVIKQTSWRELSIRFLREDTHV